MPSARVGQPRKGESEPDPVSSINDLKRVWETDRAGSDLRRTTSDGAADFVVTEYHRLSAAPETMAFVEQKLENAGERFKKWSARA